MNLTQLNAISPVDGRYGNKTQNLSKYFSEQALIRYRVMVEVKYFMALEEAGLPELQNVQKEMFQQLPKIYEGFTEQDAEGIKTIEAEINHDVKAVEYFVKEKLEAIGLGKFKEFVHFGLTSQDINNTAVPLSLKDFIGAEYLPLLNRLTGRLRNLAEDWKHVPMLARTHGQPASPTGAGKEIMVFVNRLETQTESLARLKISGKFGGATGNFNAHYVAYPDMDWPGFANRFLKKSLGIERQNVTTQIEHYDQMAALFDNMKRINTILIDLCRDVWTYISMEYFKQKVNKKEVGSSAMPHKVNPIDFENAEGNFGLANAIFAFLSAKLPVSRLQRDLTDSTVLRNIGVPCAHTIIGFNSIEKGLSKLIINEEKIREDLNRNVMVLAEAIQTVLRKKGYPNPYEQLKNLTRKGEQVSLESIHEFIDALDIDATTQQELKNLRPGNYTGNALG
jgi:adenylosuccinate lyase